jgi:rhodanese-related sulfurtransferase
MSSINTISPEKLLRLSGIPAAPVLIDVRLEEDFADEGAEQVRYRSELGR